MAMRGFCQYCRLRIYWFSSWKRWGRQSGEAKYKFRCAMHTEGGDHEPLVDEVQGRTSPKGTKTRWSPT